MKTLETNFTLDNNQFTQIQRNDKAAIYKRETSEGTFVSFEVFAIRSKDGMEVYPNKIAMSRWAFCPVSEDRANNWFKKFTDGEIPIPDIDPMTGENNPTADNRSLDELPDVNVDINTEIKSVVEDVINVEIPMDDNLSVVVDVPVVDSPIDIPVVDIPTVNLTPDGGAVVTVAKVKAPKSPVTWTIPIGEFTQAQFAVANGLPVRGVVWSRLDDLVKAGKLNEVLKQVAKGRPSQFFTAV